MDGRHLKQLETFVEQLHDVLSSSSEEVFDLHSDTVQDWEPKDRNALPLRMHYLARARPVEDERTVKSQHVAPGIFYYKAPWISCINSYCAGAPEPGEFQLVAATSQDQRDGLWLGRTGEK